MSNYFSMEIKAPDGLKGIDAHISKCEMNLEAWSSGYDEKVILRAMSNSDFEWTMDSSDTDIIYGSGKFFKGVDNAVEALESLSNILKEMKLPHITLVDDEHSYLHKEIKHEWHSEN